MKERSLRRHQEFKAKRKSRQTYNSCIRDLSPSERQALENNLEKLRKVCVVSQLEKGVSKPIKKSLRELKHDITMREQLAW